MSSRKRKPRQTTPIVPISRLRKRPRQGLADITNAGGPTLKKPCYDQLVPIPEVLNESCEDDMYCNENFEIASRKKLKVSKPLSVPGGYFSSLPPEVLHKILSLLKPNELKPLFLSSHFVNYLVRGFVYTTAGLNHVLPSLPKEPKREVSTEEFVALGDMMNAMTLCDSVSERLKVGSIFLDKLKPTHTILRLQYGLYTAYECLGLTLQAFISGWSGNGKKKAFNLIESVAKLTEKTNTVLSAKAGSLPRQEKEIRTIHRQLFLSPSYSANHEGDFGFWLTLILKPWTLTSQAKLLYLLTAPSDETGKVYWTEACGCSHLQHTTHIRLDYSELARSFRVLYNHELWTKDDVVAIFTKVTSSTPNEWCLENVALLLFGCGTVIVKAVLSKKIDEGLIDDVVMILYYMANTCVASNTEDSIDNDIAWFMHILTFMTDQFSCLEAKRQFITNLTDKWQMYIMALFEDYDPSSSTDAEVQEATEEFRATVYALARICRSLLLSNLTVNQANEPDS